MMIDTHCHIQFKATQKDLSEILLRCEKADMKLNVVGTQLDTSRKAIALAEQHDYMYASVGLHPIQEYSVPVEEEGDAFVTRGEQFDAAAYEQLAQHPKVIAIGETGLDRYHIPEGELGEKVFAKQKETFLQHAALAKKIGKPLVMHVRDAHEDMLELLESLGEPVHGVIHCFTGNWNQAERYIKLGIYLGFTGVVTYPPKKTNPVPQEELLEVIDNIPMDRLLVETDAPYLAPQQYRGKKSEPWMVADVIAFIAERRNVDAEEVRKASVENAERLFGMK
ncbi:MAG: TatD family hydrolase [Candidatus Magasanikbacteria bacterium]|jgi:TatD DNase family protein|nr:TatD family hydrolase [Candidatus Magasanikbacteria bacterium]